MSDNVNKQTSDRDPADDRVDADIHDAVQEDEDDFVENVDDAVEDIRSESVVINHFRV
jgi:hypothetical protein